MKYLIDFYNGVTEAQIDAYLEQNGYTFLKEWNNFERIVLVESDVEPVKTEIVEWVLSDDDHQIRPQMAQVDLNPYHASLVVPGLPTLSISTTDEKDWWKNYVLPNPNFDDPSVEISRKGQNVSVYIMDSGLNSSSPEFSGVSVSNIYTITGNDYNDNSGHGTAIASIIAGNSCGLTAAHIKVVKIFTPDRGTLQSEFLSALDAIMSDCPLNTFAVVNCSWSIPKNTWIESKFRELISRGLFVLAAAGNNGTPIDDVTPASMEEVITVGSFSPDLVPSTFSDYTGGSHISYTGNDVNHGALDGWAPGEKIWALALDNTYGFAAGTSMACAVASAVVAYNLTDYLQADGTRLLGWEEATLLSARAFVFSREGLLDLSDPKYSNSNNFIATLLDRSFFENKGKGLDVITARITAGSGKKSILYVVNVDDVSSLELVDSLPDNFWITSDGGLWGNPTLAQGINSVTNENYTKHVVKFQVTDKQNIVQERTLNIYIYGENFNKDDYPPDHEIQVTLLASCLASFQPQCRGQLTPNVLPCQDDCGGGFLLCCRNTYGKSSEGCYCGMFG